MLRASQHSTLQGWESSQRSVALRSCCKKARLQAQPRHIDDRSFPLVLKVTPKQPLPQDALVVS